MAGSSPAAEIAVAAARAHPGASSVVDSTTERVSIASDGAIERSVCGGQNAGAVGDDGATGSEIVAPAAVRAAASVAAAAAASLAAAARRCHTAAACRDGDDGAETTEVAPPATEDPGDAGVGAILEPVDAAASAPSLSWPASFESGGGGRAAAAFVNESAIAAPKTT